ncbi:AAA family ATPase, partial [Campylobacter concisus]|uniref:AAA family ATPase n=1 Tax=Campylobacter concisus TaxID=199 RepID=UPI0016532758
IELKFLDKDESSDTWTHDNTYKKSCESLRDELKSVLDKYQNISFDEDEIRLCDIEQKIGELKNSIDTYLNSMGYTLENINDLKKAISNVSNIETEIKSFNDRMSSIEQEIGEFLVADIDGYVNDFKNSIEEEISKINRYFAGIANSNPQNVKNIQVRYFLEDNIIDNVIDEFLKIFNQKISNTSRDYLREAGYNSVLKSKNAQEFIKSISYRNSKSYDILIDIFSLDLNFEIYKLLIEKHLRDINQYIILKVLYDNKELERSSFGQRCTAVIVILLSLGNNPIIIDEPETHLDSLLIADYLVELIKQQKNGRQIIFATHNANFVLNADAELIVKLENIDGFSTSTSFTIEDLNHREDLLKLEGGKEAFKKREQKYDI